jgi:hypothetical protein
MGIKQASEVRSPIIGPISSFSTELEPVKPEISQVIEDVVRQGLDGGSAQPATIQVVA